MRDGTTTTRIERVSNSAEACDGKVKYPTAPAAWRHLRGLEKRPGGRPGTVYRCRYCAQWHLAGKRP